MNMLIRRESADYRTASSVFEKALDGRPARGLRFYVPLRSDLPRSFQTTGAFLCHERGGRMPIRAFVCRRLSGTSRIPFGPNTRANPLAGRNGRFVWRLPASREKRHGIPDAVPTDRAAARAGPSHACLG